MPIQKVEIELLEVPQGRSFTVGGLPSVSSIFYLLVHIYTDDGAEGLGYAFSYNRTIVNSLYSLIKDLAPMAVGEDPQLTEHIFDKLFRAVAAGGPGGLVAMAIAAIETALWDIKGKLLGQPLYKVLGGSRDRVPAYASGAMWRSDPVERLPEMANAFLEQGFTGVKLKLGGEPTAEREVERVRVVRDAVGPKVTLMADLNQGWSPSQAVEIGRRLEEYNLYWLEDPVHHMDISGSAQVARSLDMPLTAGEYHYGLTPLRWLLESEAVDILMVDLLRVGGVGPWMKAAALAEAHHKPIVSHLAPEVLAHTVAAAPNGLTVEHMPWALPFLQDGPRLEEGMLVLSDAPGLGLTLDQAAVKRFRVDSA